MRQRLGARFREIRQQCQLTQEQVAEQVGLDPSYLAKVETGKRVPSLSALVRLSEVLGVPLTSIVVTIDRESGAETEFRVALDEVVAILSKCNFEQLQLVRDFSVMVKRRGYYDYSSKK